MRERWLYIVWVNWNKACNSEVISDKLWLKGLYTRRSIIREGIELIDMIVSNRGKIAHKETVRA